MFVQLMGNEAGERGGQGGGLLLKSRKAIGKEGEGQCALRIAVSVPESSCSKPIFENKAQ